jgi:hypothetical protein
MPELSPCTSWTRSNCKKKIVLIERICYKNIHLLLPNTDCLQQVEYSVAHDNRKILKLFTGLIN